MRGWLRRSCFVLIIVLAVARAGFAQTVLTWDQVKDKFESANPALKAAQINVDESRASEITARLRPNPEFNLSADGTQITPSQGVWHPFQGSTVSPGLSYLIERGNKRDLRFESAKQTTDITTSTYLDQERSLLFALRSAFVQVLQAKAVLQNAKDNLDYWDRELEVNRTRFRAGDVAEIDLNRLELQRVQFEADFQTATVNLRTSKIQLLTLLNDRTPIDQLDVTGTYDSSEQLMTLEEFRNIALAARPDLKAAMQSVDLAKLDHQLAIANGSTDPTVTGWYTHNGSWNNPDAFNTVGASVSIPLRIHDRNQGEKLRTQLDVDRNERLLDASQADVFSDVDTAYWTLMQTLNLLGPYKTKYLPLAEDNRNRITIAFQNGGASLLDLLDAEKALRDTRLAYLNLIGSYLIAAAQMNMAAGREVMQ